MRKWIGGGKNMLVEQGYRQQDRFQDKLGILVPSNATKGNFINALASFRIIPQNGIPGEKK